MESREGFCATTFVILAVRPPLAIFACVHYVPVRFHCPHFSGFTFFPADSCLAVPPDDPIFKGFRLADHLVLLEEGLSCAEIEKPSTIHSSAPSD